MAATKPSKKQRGKLKTTKSKIEMTKSHIKYDKDGDEVVPKNRAHVTKRKNAKQLKGVGKSDRSPEAIQQAKYYLERWRKRDEPKADGELPWKFKKNKQQWILRWMYEADVIPKSMFAIVLEYLDGIQGAARKRELDNAQKILDAGIPPKDEEIATEEDKQKMFSIKLARRRFKRALQIAELLA